MPGLNLLTFLIVAPVIRKIYRELNEEERI